MKKNIYIIIGLLTSLFLLVSYVAILKNPNLSNDPALALQALFGKGPKKNLTVEEMLLKANPCFVDKDNNNIIEPFKGEINFGTRLECAKWKGSSAGLLPISKNQNEPSTYIPAEVNASVFEEEKIAYLAAVLKAGNINTKPGKPSTNCPGLPAGSICGNTADHYRQCFEKQGYESTFTSVMCDFEFEISCKTGNSSVSKVKLPKITSGHAVTDLHIKGKTSYYDGTTKKYWDLDANGDGVVNQNEMQNENLWDESAFGPTVKKDLQTVCKANGGSYSGLHTSISNCSIISEKNRDDWEKKYGRTPRSWSEYKPKVTTK